MARRITASALAIQREQDRKVALNLARRAESAAGIRRADPGRHGTGAGPPRRGVGHLQDVGHCRAAPRLMPGAVRALAQRIAAGDWATALAHKYHPGYPAMVALAHVFIPDWEGAALAVSVLAGALAVGALYALLREGFDRRVAAVGG
jgi:hypothetical protein